MFDFLIESFHLVFIEKDRYKVFLQGLGNTLLIAITALVIGIAIGTILAIIKVNPSKSKLKRFFVKCADCYILIFRGTPLVVQLLLTYFVILANVGIEPLIIAIVVFGMNSGAYAAESIRSGINSIDKGQMEACRSLGLNYPRSMQKVIMPQAIKNILPQLGNEFISLLKETSVAGFITVMDLTKAAQSVVANAYTAMVPYITLALIYLILVLFFTKLLHILERKLQNDTND